MSEIRKMKELRNRLQLHLSNRNLDKHALRLFHRHLQTHRRIQGEKDTKIYRKTQVQIYTYIERETYKRAPK